MKRNLENQMITRKEYMADSAKLHHAYYLQFATPATFQIVRSSIGVATIKESTDPHMNDIPLRRWDLLDNAIRHSVRKDVKIAADAYPSGNFTWSLSDTTCVAKAVALEIKKEESE